MLEKCEFYEKMGSINVNFVNYEIFKKVIFVKNEIMKM